MKKLIAMLLAIVILASVGLVGCAKDDDKDSTTKATEAATYVVLEEALAAEEYSVGFRKADLALCQEVERILGEMKADGALMILDEIWFGEEVNIFDATKAGTGATDDSLKKVKAAGKLVMGLDDSFPPMGYRDEDNKIVGYDVDVATEVCVRMGVELVLQPIAWSAKEQEINSGNIDCIWNGFTTTPERREALCMSTPYLTNSQVVVTLSTSGINTPADLAGKTLAVQGGSTAMDALDSKPEIKAGLKGGAAVEVENNVIAMFDLKSGGSDAVLMDKVVADYYVSHPDAKK
jgi:ABC-type amino acid transport substrate-binding protein